jgi:2-isopropylmalate synthase
MKAYKMHQSSMPFRKYSARAPLRLPDRTWPNNVITKAPYWCSVDLRDGNQALIEPMDGEEKLKMFRLLVRMGFKEIETGFPSASTVEYDFTRYIIEHDLIPDDVTIQVCSQAREEQIIRTMQAIRGARRATYHVYNSTSPTQRRVVFNCGKKEVLELATHSTRLVKKYAAELLGGKTDLTLQYSPESFTATETEFAVEVCAAVMQEWGPTVTDKMIINLPATVEISSPNVYADQVEWFIRNLPNRDRAIVSVHCHNDRGGAIAASELGVLAGAERVEGTLFGNGERTGNADLVTLAMNLFAHGIDPCLEIANMKEIMQVAEECNKIPIHIRHPYAGKLVFTAFSGSHQDAIRKGLKARQPSDLWDIPYLPIDPRDVGASYKEVIRVNSQSGKSGIAYILESHYNIALTRGILTEFRQIIQQVAEFEGGEVSPEYILGTFKREYIQTSPNSLSTYTLVDRGGGSVHIDASAQLFGKIVKLAGPGVGPLDALVKCLSPYFPSGLDLSVYNEYALGEGKDTQAFCLICLSYDGGEYYGVGIDSSTITASFQAIFSALNRMVMKKMIGSSMLSEAHSDKAPIRSTGVAATPQARAALNNGRPANG